jgi:hypothetical protein
MALLYGCTGRLTDKNGGFRPGQSSFAWLTVGGANATLAATPAGDVTVTAPGTAAVRRGGAVVIEYLQGDWPMPSIYAKVRKTPSLPRSWTNFSFL